VNKGIALSRYFLRLPMLESLAHGLVFTAKYAVIMVSENEF